MNSFRTTAQPRRSMLCEVAILAIRFYQVAVSPLLRRRGVTCLHFPSCSQYGVLAFQKYGFCKACSLTIGRWRACHPFSGRPYIDFP